MLAIFWAILAIIGYFLNKKMLPKFALLWDDSIIFLGEI